MLNIGLRFLNEIDTTWMYLLPAWESVDGNGVGWLRFTVVGCRMMYSNFEWKISETLAWQYHLSASDSDRKLILKAKIVLVRSGFNGLYLVVKQVQEKNIKHKYHTKNIIRKTSWEKYYAVWFCSLRFEGIPVKNSNVTIIDYFTRKWYKYCAKIGQCCNLKLNKFIMLACNIDGKYFELRLVSL